MKNILCFGDSNTYGLIPRIETRFEYEDRWTGIINERFFPKGFRVIEEGLCGRTTMFDDYSREGRNGAKMLPLLIETHAPVEAVVIMLGTNDCKTYYDASADKISYGIKKLVDIIKFMSPNSKILVISPIHLGDDIWNGFDLEYNEKSVKVSKSLEEAYKRTVNAYENVSFLAASNYAKASAGDRQHMDREGHKSLAKAVGDELEKIL